ncbi:sulfite exporter TauE/SafE family protein [Candidatus Woesebacteria bacterium]|nr:sulfite exporter TauE/SafE family protein [Candidatus Woesebacteria bacterium]
MINLWTIFITGLVTGGLSCLAVQGGLLAATIAQNEEEKLKSKTKQTGNAVPILAFLTAKLVAYTALGFLLGWFGSLFQISLATQVVMQFLVALFMIGTALNILDVHPIFRYFAIQPPRFVTKLVRNQSKSKNIFAPALLGAFTVFIPCGTTQAMMALAIGSANPFLGAMVLFAFVLGTSPLFFILGYFATRLGDSMHKRFMKVAAVTLIVLALFNIRNVLALSGTDIGLSMQPNTESQEPPVSEATIEFSETTYNPSSITVKAGSDVKLNLSNVSGGGCIQAFTIPKLGIQKIVAVGTQDVLQFTAPREPQRMEFMCSMGMYRGVINVI